MTKPKAPPFRIVIDTREQTPWTFPDWPTVTKHLKTGDVSISGLERYLCIERKSLPDLAGCCSDRKDKITGRSNRDRFKDELQRMRAYNRRCVIVEATYPEALTYHGRGKIGGKQITGSTTSWEGDFDVPFHYVSSNVKVCAAYALNVLRAFHRHHVMRCIDFLSGMGAEVWIPEDVYDELNKEEV